MILHHLSLALPNVQQFSGYDISPFAIERSKKIENDRLRFFQQAFPDATTNNVELLLLLDVVEHVDDYYQLLRDLKNCADRFIFHIPLDLSCRMLLKPHILLQQRTTVGHIHYFSKETIFWALQDTGYELRDWFYTKPISDTSASSNVYRWLKKTSRNLFYALAPDLCVKLFGSYSVLVLLEKKADS
jgi:hypothetical protein